MFKNGNNSNNFSGKHMTRFEISWYWPKNVQNDPKFVRDSNSTLKFLTFQLSNVRELETIKYAFDSWLFLYFKGIFRGQYLVWTLHENCVEFHNCSRGLMCWYITNFSLSILTILRTHIHHYILFIIEKVKKSHENRTMFGLWDKLFLN